MSTLTPNYGLIVPDGSDTVEQVRADYATNLNTIDGIGGGGSGGHTIVNPSGTDMPAEGKLQFTGGVTVTDDSVNGKTVVDILGSSVVELTQAQYEALPDSKLTDDILYGLKDVKSFLDADILYLGTCYSLSERMVGCWIDGKPLYAKTYHFTSGWVNDNWTDMTDLSGLNIDTFVKSDFSVSKTDNSLQYTGNGSIRPESSGQNPTISARYYSNHLQVMVNNFNDIVRLDITIIYTKTTDVAGSGTWTPSGVNAVHYDNTEKVIGTWFGETLYEKTISLTSGIAIGSYGHISLPADSIIRGLEGYIYRSNHAVVDKFNGYIADGELFAIIRSGQIEYWISNIFDPVEEITFTIQYTKSS